jgi:exodeoxyribonuclease V alpha subunit
MALGANKVDLFDTAVSDSLSGTVQTITYHNKDNGYSVIKVKVDGHKNLVTLIGHLTSVHEGERITSEGTWITHKQFGRQFKAETVSVAPPASKEGLVNYLSSGLIPGIGPVTAKKLVEAFGEGVFDVIEKTPERLREVQGIGGNKLVVILNGWKDQKAVKDIMVFLSTYGVSANRATRIYKTYGIKAIEKIQENPYCLAYDVHGIGFTIADQMAARMGIGRESLQRAQAGINYVLTEARSQGHCGLPVTELVKRAKKLLELEEPLIATAIKEEQTNLELVLDDLDGEPCAFLPQMYYAEVGVASRMLKQCEGLCPWRVDEVDEALAQAEEAMGLTFSDEQKDVIRLSLKHKVSVITGGPGCGKSTIMRALMQAMDQASVEVALAAPTGRAAKRLSETTGREATTIHRLLEVDGKSFGFKRNDTNPLNCDVVIIDEVSMMDTLLMNSLLKALPKHAALILVGDVDQLPSVGPGKILKDLIDSGVMAVGRLTQIFRQAKESHIITNAHRVNAGVIPTLDDNSSDFRFVEVPPKDEVALLAALRRVVQEESMTYDPITEIQVLTPMNRGGAGTVELNNVLRDVSNPAQKEKVERFGITYRMGDRVMQTANDYDRDVYNGDLGRISQIDRENNSLVVDFAGREVAYSFDELDELVPAYAITIHKSQGGEFPSVVMVLTSSHFLMLKRNLVYTGMTRASKRLTIIGDKKALAMAVKDSSSMRRYTKLKTWLIEKRAQQVADRQST